MASVAYGVSGAAQWAGRPLWSSLLLVGLPIFFIIFLSAGLEVEIPGALLYAVGGGLALLLVISTVRNVEWLLAAIVVYLPLSKIMPVIVVPGLNGVNILLLLLVAAWLAAVQNGSCSFVKGIPYGRLMLMFAIVSSLSVLTILRDPIGKAFFFDTGITEFKGWLDQFILFFGFANLIASGAMARRIVVYCFVGTVIAEMFGILEMLSKVGARSIEEARVLGPVLQPNNYGAFIVYNLSPVIAFAVLNYRKWYVLLLLPYLAISLKLLLATFSRGAYIGLALSGMTATFFRGLLFTMLAGGLGLIAVSQYPGLVPDALRDRMGSTTDGYYSTTYDDSANSRLVLWEAALEMTGESPVLGKGYLGFQLLKSQYTDVPVQESDTHNMYLYISSQMGVPALLLFLSMLFGFFQCSLRVYRNANDDFSKVIGLGGLAMIAGVLAINMFGTRMINSEVSGYFWIYFAVLIAILRENEARNAMAAIVRKRETTDHHPTERRGSGSTDRPRPGDKEPADMRMRYSVIP